MYKTFILEYYLYKNLHSAKSIDQMVTKKKMQNKKNRCTRTHCIAISERHSVLSIRNSSLNVCDWLVLL